MLKNIKHNSGKYNEIRHTKGQINHKGYKGKCLGQCFLTFFAPWTPKSRKNFHGALNYQSVLWWTPEYL